MISTTGTTPLPGDQPTQGLYLHRATRHRKTNTNIHVVSRIRTHDLRHRAIKAYASDRAATGIGPKELQLNKFQRHVGPHWAIKV
jgi:hypothetical protein